MRALPIVSLLGLAAIAACGHAPPYGPGAGPSVNELMDATTPQVEAVAVGEARIVLNRLARGDLALLAQAPARFRASVTKAGNELVTLAFSEVGYAVRYLLDEGMPQGFYAGPPDPCAVERTLGVPLSYEGLVATVLGGGPIIDAPYEVTRQRWNRREGYEALTLQNERFVEELRFGKVAGAWTFVGAEVWPRNGEQVGARSIWALAHERTRDSGGLRLPMKTRIKAPNDGRENLVVITYKTRDLDPAFARLPLVPAPAGGEPVPDPGGWDTQWGDDSGWEDGAAPADDAKSDAPAVPPASAAALANANDTAPPEPATAPRSASATPEQPLVPPVFALDAAGLPARGDLCR